MNSAPPPNQGHGLNVDLAPRTSTLFSVRSVLLVIPLLLGLGVVGALLIPAMNIRRPPNKKRLAGSQFMMLKLALEAYRTDFDSYPPDNTPSANSSENLWYYLAQPVTTNSQTHGPYLDLIRFKTEQVGQYPELHSLLGGKYEYKLLTPGKDGSPRYELVDPGADGKLGGNIDPDKGFVKTSADADDNFTTESN